MGKKSWTADNLIDALVWMRRNAEKHEPVDDLINWLVSMQSNAKSKTTKGKRIKGKRRLSLPRNHSRGKCR
jgi:hypothetical protein